MPELTGISVESGLLGIPAIPALARAPLWQPEGPSPGAPKAPSGDAWELSPEAQRLVAELKATGARVRAHEAAHLAAAGGLARGGPSYTFQRGPDGKVYAVGGEVSIDSGGVPGNPEASLAKARRIQQAALAPSDPSPQDRAVAAAASSMAAGAQADLAAQEASPNPEGRGNRVPDGAWGPTLDLQA